MDARAEQFAKAWEAIAKTVKNGQSSFRSRAELQQELGLTKTQAMNMLHSLDRSGRLECAMEMRPALGGVLRPCLCYALKAADAKK